MPKCPRCHGSGQIRLPNHYDGDPTEDQCPACLGSGMADIAHLKQAEAPTKVSLLAYLDELRDAIEAGSVLALICIPIHPNREFSTRSVGDIGALAMAGMLGRAWLDANELLKL